MRSRAFVTLLRKPSWVCAKETAFPTFDFAAPIRLICASKRNETANPAASSSGETIFDPEDKRLSDFASAALDSPSKRALLWADIFVLITIRLLPLSRPSLLRAFCFPASLPADDLIRVSSG